MAIKEKKIFKKLEKKSDWIIDNGCPSHITRDMNKFVKFRNHNGGIVRVGNNVACHIMRIGSITHNEKTKNDGV